MCGIAGFIGKNGHWQQDIINMCDKMVHRGPDAEGFWSDDNTAAVLGHRRLSILDLSENGRQPMMSHSGRYVISFNGEIYNYKLLAKELYVGNTAVNLKTGTDTEILLEAIERWGLKETLKKSRGMFAFALFDRKDRILFLARDRVGEKPLYYGKSETRFVFASELACMTGLADFNNKICPEALKIYLQHGYIPAPYSIFEDIYKLEPGTIVAVREDGQDIRTDTYWSMEEAALKGQQNPFRGSEDEATEELKKLLKESISLQMLADVPVGAFLSAGIDSSTIVSLMQEISSIPVKTFTIGMQDEKYNEAVFAKEIAQILGTNHTELYISEKDAQEMIPQLSYYYSEPFADSSQIPTMLVSRLAKERVTVALSGDGGDELFAGYSYYSYVNSVWGQIERVPKPLRGVGGWAARNVPLLNKTKLAQKGKVLCKSPEKLYCWARTNSFNKKILKKDINAYSKNDLCESWILDECQHNLMLMDLQMYHPDDILVKVDRAAMASSLETRIPMLDVNVIEFAWSLPFQYKKSEDITKKVLKDILYQYVPKELMERPKTGFSIPIDKWLRQGRLKEWGEDILGSPSLVEENFFNYQEIRKIWDNFIQNGIWNYTLWYLLVFFEWKNSIKKVKEKQQMS